MKKNLRKIPSEIFSKISEIKTKEIVAGCALKFKTDALHAGQLKHLGITLTTQGLQVPATVLPSASQGKYSTRNIEGLVIVRDDLPMETHHNAVETPNWGDFSNGTHTVYLPYEKYLRQFKAPRELEISMACKDCRPDLPIYVIAFKVNEVLDTTSKHFEDKLLENLNLLQENVGACGVERADTSMEAYMKTLHVSWELLPPGTRNDAIERLFRGRVPSPQETEVAGERYDFFMRLKPKRLVYGLSGLRRYFGALLEENLVIFENIQYGNAIYVLFENWEELSRRSRLDLLSGKYGTDFERVIHSQDWKGQVRSIVAARRAAAQTGSTV